MPRFPKLRVIDSMLEAFVANELTLIAKTAAFRWSFSLAAIATGFLGLGVILQVLYSTTPWGR